MSIRDLIKKNIIRLLTSLPLPVSAHRPVVYMYHSISPRSSVLSISPEVLESQLQFLQKNGYHTIKIADMADPGFVLTPKTVCLTFDDGFEDNYIYAVPLLRRYGCSATFFVPTEYIGKESFREGFKGMNMLQIKELADDPLFEIGSHAMHHNKFTHLNQSTISAELRESKAFLEREISRPVVSFAFPYGKFHDEDVSVAKNAGYRVVCTTIRRRLHNPVDIFCVPRFVVDEATVQFFDKFGTWGYEWYWRMYEFIMSLRSFRQ